MTIIEGIPATKVWTTQLSGLPPDLEMAPLKDGSAYGVQRETGGKKRISIDPALKAALQIPVAS